MLRPSKFVLLQGDPEGLVPVLLLRFHSFGLPKHEDYEILHVKTMVFQPDVHGIPVDLSKPILMETPDYLGKEVVLLLHSSDPGELFVFLIIDGAWTCSMTHFVFSER